MTKRVSFVFSYFTAWLEMGILIRLLLRSLRELGVSEAVSISYDRPILSFHSNYALVKEKLFTLKYGYEHFFALPWTFKIYSVKNIFYILERLGLLAVNYKRF